MKTGTWRRHVWLLAACGAPFFWVAPSQAQTPTFTVSGQVVERIHMTWIGGATVRLSGRAAFVTDSDGEFKFNGVPSGSYTFTVEAMGYRPSERTLVVRADTVFQVGLDVDPVRLDSLLVKAGTITLRGRVTDRATGRQIPQARVQADSRFTTFTSAGGSFRIKKLPRGFSIPVQVDAFKYLPARIALITEVDTTLTIELEPDSLGIQLFEVTSERLEVRSRAVSLSTIALDRRYMERAPSRSAYDVIKWRLGGRDFSGQCLFIDEIKQPDKGALDSYMAGELERIEIYGRGTMVRVYTQAFIAKMLGWSQTFHGIVYVPGGIGPDTCY